jgi:hypothetical protein
MKTYPILAVTSCVKIMKGFKIDSPGATVRPDEESPVTEALHTGTGIEELIRKHYHYPKPILSFCVSLRILPTPST